MRLQFTKMHGLGNDFVVIDGINQYARLTSEQIKKIADRHFGIGCDQVLLVEAPQNADVDFRYRIFNGDGSEAENCGNGARCFARFVLDRQLTGKSTILVETCNGRMTLQVQANGEVTVNMGIPGLEPDQIPFIAPKRQSTYSLALTDGSITIAAVSMGNPHAVTVVDNVSRAPVTTMGREIETHPDFPNRVNAGFMEIVSSSEVNLRVFERGVGETLACGTGACAAMVSGRLQGLLDQQVQVNLPGGSLNIRWSGEGHPVMLTGPATCVFDGRINL